VLLKDKILIKFRKVVLVMDIYKKLDQLQIKIPDAPAKGGVYTPAREFGDKLVYVSGCGPQVKGICEFPGKVGREVTFEQAQQSARNCILNILAVLQAQIGDLNRVKQFVKMLAFISSDNGFAMQPQVANAASQLLVDIFGEECGCASRSAIGVNILPGDIPVEIEILVELN